MFLAVLAGPATGRTIYVDPNGSADFTTIQAAIEDANDGDEIEVTPGTYNEAINFNGKAVRLYSSGGPEVTTIDANGIPGAYHVVQCVSGEDANTVLDGFTISDGNAYGPDPNDQSGGGMFNYQSSPIVTNCTFSGNSAEYYGGGMSNINNSSPMVTNCAFSGNDATYGGGMHTLNNSNPTVTNCTFSGNAAISWGGGMRNFGSSPTVTNCTFSGNTVKYQSGGGMHNYDSSPTITNCIFWGDAPDEIYDVRSSSIVSYSDVQGGWPGTGNIDADPNFAHVITLNLRLLPSSPCIDAADNNSVPPDMADLDSDGNTVEPTPFDLNDFPRFVDDLCTVDTGNPGTPGPPVIDMGAYEFLPADIDSNGTVDLRDLCIFTLHWAETDCGRCGGANMTCDGIVDWNDVRELVAHWLAGAEP
jgi:hypothetical protein